MLRLSLILLVICITPAAFAQQQLHDIIYLDDGTTILGTIVGSLRGESVRIITDDASVFHYKSHRVVKITPAPRPYSAKSPAAALAMSCVLPSLGQFYNEEPEKGLVFMGINILCVASIVVGNIYKEQDYDDLGDTFIASGVLYLVLGWGVSMMDAYTSAQNINRQIYLSPAVLNLQPINIPDGFGARLAFEF